ncbi:MAG TPA: hypothetical protein VFP84_35465, partial [Kofleriaceae bacterium]|nr:hypothetical protein [Kofleriaceae bacterium]
AGVAGHAGERRRALVSRATPNVPEHPHARGQRAALRSNAAPAADEIRPSPVQAAHDLYSSVASRTDRTEEDLTPQVAITGEMTLSLGSHVRDAGRPVLVRFVVKEVGCAT